MLGSLAHACSYIAIWLLLCPVIKKVKHEVTCFSYIAICCAHSGVLELGAAGPICSYSYLVVQIIFTGGVRSLETFVWPGHQREFKIGDLWMVARLHGFGGAFLFV